MQRRRVLLGLAAVAGAGLIGEAGATTGALPPELAQDWPRARLVGGGRLRFFGLHVYDTRLWSVGEAARAWADDWHRLPLALEIQYARAFEARDIAERSIKEMRRQATFAEEAAQNWTRALQRVLPDVRAGDRITGLHLPGEKTRFFHNGRFVGEVADGEFTRLFFGIWLSPATSEPRLRESLLGLAADR